VKLRTPLSYTKRKETMMFSNLRKLFSEEPRPCPICGREMIRGYSNPKAIVDDMCPCPHPIVHIPHMRVPE
jgi:hypothetical protein